LVTGFDGKDGQRFVTVLNVPLHFQEKILPDQEVAIFSMGKANVWDFHQSENFIGIFKNTEDLKIALPKDCPALFITTTRKWTDDEIIETGVAESLLDLNRYRRDNTSYVADLLSQVDYNGNTGVDSWLKLDDKKINKIINLSDIDGLDNSTMPVLYGMTLSNFNK